MLFAQQINGLRYGSTSARVLLGALQGTFWSRLLGACYSKISIAILYI